MIRECKVILNNDAVTVVKFDNKEIQFPSIHKKKDTVFVKMDNNSYSIVDKESADIEQLSKKSQKLKKTTTKSSIKEIESAKNDGQGCIVVSE